MSTARRPSACSTASRRQRRSSTRHDPLPRSFASSRASTTSSGPADAIDRLALISPPYSRPEPSMTRTDDFLVAERSYCDDDSKLSVGLANIHAAVPDVEANQDKILRAVSVFKERGVNIAVFPEFCLSGYFWDEREDCLAYMREAVDRAAHRLDRARAAAADRRRPRGDRAQQPDRGRAGGLLPQPHVRRRPRRRTTSPTRTRTTRSSCRASRSSTPRAGATTASCWRPATAGSASPRVTTTSSTSCCASTRWSRRSTRSCRSRRGGRPATATTRA